MTKHNRPLLGLLLATSTALTSFTLPAAADAVFDQPAAFTGQVQLSGADRSPAYAGKSVEVRGSRFQPGQEVRLSRGADLLTEALTADAEGNFTASFDLPADAVAGRHPIVVQTESPDSAEVITLKVSPEIPFSGEDQFDIAKVAPGKGLYQIAFSPKSNAYFVTGAVGRPPVKESELLKLDAATLDTLTKVTPAAAPAQGDREGGLFAVYGVGVDDANDTVWVTNTRQNTVAIYAQSDLNLIKQFEPGVTDHPRDVVVDAERGRAYVSAASQGIVVFDTATQEMIEVIEIPSKQRRETFTAMSLALDPQAHVLYTPSLTTPEVARINLADNTVQVFALSDAAQASGIDIDPANGRMFVASQGSDNVIALDAEGKELFNTKVGSGALNVAYDASHNRVYVVSRGSDSLAAVDADTGEIIANLNLGSFPNFLDVTENGDIIAVNKARGAEDGTGDQVWRLTPKQ